MSVVLCGSVRARIVSAAARCVGVALIVGCGASAAEAGCSNAVSGVVTCTGDVFNGAAFGSGVSELNVHSLTRNIRPATGDSAVSLIHGNPVVNIDLGERWAITNDATAIGIGTAGGSVTLDISNARIATSGSFSHGVAVGATAGIDFNFDGVVKTTGESSRAIWGHSYGGGDMNFDITSSIYTTGIFGDAIKVEGTDNVFVQHSGRSTTLGESAEGFYLRSTDGTITLRSVSALSTSGNFADAIEARALQDVAIVQAGVVRTAGIRAHGVYARSDEKTVRISTNSTIVTEGAFSNAIEAEGLQGVSIWAKGAMRTSGKDSLGIHASSAEGAAVIVSDLNISTFGDRSTGISAEAATTVHVNNRGAIGTSGVSADGIHAYGQGNVRVSNKGSVNTLGAGSNGINARSANGNVLVLQQGSLIALGTDSSGIVANGQLTNQVNIYNGTIIGGGGSGAAVSLNGGASRNLVINWGALYARSNRVVAGSEFADIVVNIGTMTGFVSLGDGDDVVVNDGLFKARGDSDFGNGSVDVFVNRGSYQVLNAGGSDVIRLRNLEHFVNTESAEIIMQDGQTGGRLEISGNFIGGGRLLVDAKAGEADQVKIGGTVTGTTFVNVAYRRGGGVISSAGLPVIDVSAGTTDPSNFRLENGPIQDGLLEYGLLSRNDGVWTLVGSVTRQAGTLLGYTSSGSYAWNATGDAWNDYIAGFNGGGAQAGFNDRALIASRFTASDGSAAGRGAGSGVWFKMLGGGRDGFAMPATGGAGFANSEMTGYQAGADYNLLAGRGAGDPRLIAGVTFGTSNFSDEHLSAPSQDSPNARNAGVYLAYADGALDAGLLVKADYMDLVYADTDVEAGDLSFASFGFQGQLGYSLTGPSQPWTLRVNTAMRFTQSKIDDAVFGNVPVSFGGQTEMVSTTGLTLSYLSGGKGVAGLPASGDAPAYRFAFGANIEQDLLRRHDLRIADYEALRDNDLRTFLGLSARFDWNLGGLTAGAAVNYHKGLTSAASELDSLSATVGIKHKF